MSADSVRGLDRKHEQPETAYTPPKNRFTVGQQRQVHSSEILSPRHSDYSCHSSRGLHGRTDLVSLPSVGDSSEMLSYQEFIRSRGSVPMSLDGDLVPLEETDETEQLPQMTCCQRVMNVFCKRKTQ